jgi:hypothetical protein
MSLLDEWDNDDDDDNDDDNDAQLNDTSALGNMGDMRRRGVNNNNNNNNTATSSTSTSTKQHNADDEFDVGPSVDAHGHASTTLAVAPVFALEQVQFTPPHNIVQLVVASNTLVLALANCHVIRLNINDASKLSTVEISKRSGDRIHRLHLDPSGTHLLVAMVSEECYYLHAKWAKPRLLTKLRGIVVESVAWDAATVTPTYSGDLLLGTVNGRIFQAAVEATDKGLVERFAGSVTAAASTAAAAVVGQQHAQREYKQLYDLGEQHVITGLRVERFPPSGRGETKFMVMATTPTRIYQFIGGPTYEALFAAYATSPSFQEVPGNTPRSELHFFSEFGGGLPRTFAWMTGPGVFHGELSFSSQNKGDSVATDTTLLPYPRDGNAPAAPLSMALTEFHFLLLDAAKCRAIHKLSEKVVFESTLPTAQCGRVRGLATDALERTIWVYCERAVFEVTINDEDRDVWQMYLERKQFETALRHCKTATQKDRVWSAQGDYLFSQGSFELAATVYAKTLRSFEELALLFVQRNERAALRTLLMRKLVRLRPERDRTQITSLCTWLVEIHLERLNEARDALRNFDADNAAAAAAAAVGADKTRQSKRAALEQRVTLCNDELRAFEREWKSQLDRHTTLALIGAHGREDELLAYASLVGDNARVVEHHLQCAEYGKALDVLCQQDNLELYYKYSPPLMHHVPHDTVNVWIGEPRLEPRRLIPALMRYDPANNPPGETQNQAVRYLEHVIYRLRVQDRAIDDYLLSLHAMASDDRALLQFLAKPETLTTIDLKYALRLCTKYGKTRACVLIYSALQLYEEAVELALQVDIELAKEHADKPEDDDELRKKLWLRIARHVVQKQRDIKTAMSFLQQCPLLQIEDILPFFPDFTRIDEFRDEICASLAEYGNHIQQLKREMDVATRSADLIRTDIKELRNKYGFVSTSQKCELCRYTAMSRQFYLFPCQHVFHATCLTKEVLANSSMMQRRRVAELARKLADVSALPAPSGASQSTDARREARESELDALRSELNALVAGECVLCGDIMMRSIERPFVDGDEEAEVASWSLD